MVAVLYHISYKNLSDAGRGLATSVFPIIFESTSLPVKYSIITEGVALPTNKLLL